MQPLTRGRYKVRLATGADEIAAAQRLRHEAFRAGRHAGKAGSGRDEDAFDASAQHVLVQDTACGTVVATYRVQVFRGDGIAQSYAAQFYDLSRLALFPAPMLEMGRFCLDPSRHDPDILRLAWAAMTRIVDAGEVGLMFGCSSFAGADPDRHAAALAALAGRVAPVQWRPGPRAPERIGLPGLPGSAPAGASAMPPLLRTYLSMGGWVSDHAVIDHDLDTLHVLTGVEISAIPPARARALRMIAGN